ncbi:MAG: DUF885 domain-containing protein [Suilimivivens sp.]|nr:DUF885 domain-containing protein [Lachnospiraceae bacterium]MDY5869387.1 DUF885 domain-containing protein [Lachnospiraceae bacterium]
MLSRLKLSRRLKYYFFLLLSFLGFLFLLFCLLTNDARQFKSLTKTLFISELSSDTLSLHYTLAYPEDYDLDGKAVLPCYQPGKEENAAYLESILERLSEISPRYLSSEDAYTYQLLTRHLTLQLSGSDFAYYGEPLSPSSGMVSGLPILLADYTFRSEKDVEDYLNILDQTDTYFEGLIQYETEKSAQGLFMPDSSAEKIIEQCGSIMDQTALSSGEHFLHTTFQERLVELENEGLITEDQKLHWISENDRLLTTVMKPSYEAVADAFTLLSGSGKNSMGLSHFPKGRAYYEYLFASTTGSSRSISEAKQMLYQDFQQNYAALLSLMGNYPELISMNEPFSSDFPFSTPEEMLVDLQSQMKTDFPAFPQFEDGFIPSCTVKSVSPAMEKYCSPAYYLTPPMDDMQKNTIYINHRNQPDALTLYTTLAHEGYPGHLYQTVYSQLALSQKAASPVRRILHYGGYVEGWALYVENLSYYYAQNIYQNEPSKAAWCEACRLNRNIQLCLYSLLDIAIHYEGATPAQVQAILEKIGITNPASVTAIYQYIVEEPTTYPKYYLGFLEFQELKEEAATQWDDKFSLMRFHRFVLEAGPSDFTSLRTRLTASPIG